MAEPIRWARPKYRRKEHAFGPLAGELIPGTIRETLCGLELQIAQFQGHVRRGPKCGSCAARVTATQGAGSQ